MNKPRFETLDDWLNWQETLHPSEIELGLDRVAQVYRRLQPENFKCPVITVAGTNGKGSSICMLESIYLACGYRTACYTSPHLIRYNERIRLNGEAVADDVITTAFQHVDNARADISLTYFEFGTLAALDIFMQFEPDVVLLEVGLGGRLDAVNIVDADMALITSISLDHTHWLGEDRETIAREKAGILRMLKPAVCSDPDVPAAVIQTATTLNTPLYRIGHEFCYQQNNTSWQWQFADTEIDLPAPGLYGQHQYQNAAGVVMVVELMQASLPVSLPRLAAGLKGASLSGRYQHLNINEAGKGADWIGDVAHNPDGLKKLANNLQQDACSGKTYALLGMLADKDIKGALANIVPEIEQWHLIPLPSLRAANVVDLKEVLTALGVEAGKIYTYASISEAKHALEKISQKTDRIIVFGSFYTLSEVMKLA